MILTKIKNGSVLLAEPSLLGDTHFQRSVILITKYSKKGIVGFIANKPLLHTISEILPEVTDEHRIYNGGPVEQESLYFLHTRPDLIPSSTEVCQDVYWGGDFDKVADLLISKEINSSEIKFFLGYTGWGFDQLNTEINENNWIVQNLSNTGSLIKNSANFFWKNTLENLGGKYQIWANAPENPNHN